MIYWKSWEGNDNLCWAEFCQTEQVLQTLQYDAARCYAQSQNSELLGRLGMSWRITIPLRPPPNYINVWTCWNASGTAALSIIEGPFCCSKRWGYVQGRTMETAQVLKLLMQIGFELAEIYVYLYYFWKNILYTMGTAYKDYKPVTWIPKCKR